ncbi:hypothetical protein BRSU_0046 [Brachyspira suanatina]|uniref:Uncharacterized protein n=1 Tax=Brachyspira suanatina TaxID=381802 RepID=A0A0G4K3E1_9SPIR|nr:hypothetical protein BRSU_0046 [Brachyspira suanatina]
MNKTIEAFKDDIHGSLKLREKILLKYKVKNRKRNGFKSS